MRGEHGHRKPLRLRERMAPQFLRLLGVAPSASPSESIGPIRLDTRAPHRTSELRGGPQGVFGMLVDAFRMVADRSQHQEHAIVQVENGRTDERGDYDLATPGGEPLIELFGE